MHKGEARNQQIDAAAEHDEHREAWPEVAQGPLERALRERVCHAP
jgi:hypothetical protein